MGRKELSDFKETTLETFKESIDPRIYKHIEHKHTILFPYSNSRIIYGGFDKIKNIEKFNSAEYGAVFVDQAEEISQKEYSMARGSLQRYKLPDGSYPNYRMILTANPAQNWLKRHFITHREPDTAFVQALPSDNPHLNPAYVENLKNTYRFRPELLQAYLFGSWDALESADVVVKMKWIEQCLGNTVINPDNVERLILSVDCARMGDDETVIWVIKNFKIIDKWIFGQQTTDVTANRIAQKYNEHKAEFVAIDNDNIGASIGDNLAKLNINVRRYTMAGKADKPDQFINKRAEIIWTIAEKFAKREVCIPANEEELVRQINCYTYKMASKNRIQIRSKEEIKKDIGKSPDQSDSAMIGFFACGEAEGKKPDDPRFHRYNENFYESDSSAMGG
jgi:PBSX family phage terminase large subunit